MELGVSEEDRVRMLILNGLQRLLADVTAPHLPGFSSPLVGQVRCCLGSLSLQGAGVEGQPGQHLGRQRWGKLQAQAKGELDLSLPL